MRAGDAGTDRLATDAEAAHAMYVRVVATVRAANAAIDREDYAALDRALADCESQLRALDGVAAALGGAGRGDARRETLLAGVLAAATAAQEAHRRLALRVSEAGGRIAREIAELDEPDRAGAAYTAAPRRARLDVSR